MVRFNYTARMVSVIHAVTKCSVSIAILGFRCDYYLILSPLRQFKGAFPTRLVTLDIYPKTPG